MRRLIAVVAASVVLSPASIFGVASAQAGDWLFPGWCLPGCGSPDDCCCRCCAPQCRECEEEDDDYCYSFAPPPGPVVSSIPAIMLAQGAVAVAPQRLEQAFRAQYQREDREKFARELLETLRDRAQGEPARQQRQANGQIDEAQLQQLRREVERLKQTTQQLVELLEEVKRQAEP